MEVARNTFVGGMNLDLNGLNQKTDTLSNALNATLLTYNGNENMLQNDMGNVKLTDATLGDVQLKPGYIPLGAKEFGGIIYIASCDPTPIVIGEGDDAVTYYKSEIGCFPSPDYTMDDETHKYVNMSGKLKMAYLPLNIGTINNIDVPLNTLFLNFDTEHSVEILAEHSFDGSINLILTDNKTEPKLINTGFLTLEDGTYEIISRYGNNNTNRYELGYDYSSVSDVTDLNTFLSHKSTFNLQSSLYRNTDCISKFEFKGLKEGGKLFVGTYVFYAIACDKDGNETDYICESGVIPVFIGTDGDPYSINGGMENQQTDKSISIKVAPVDNSYKFIKLCYSRSTAANGQNGQTTAVMSYKISKKYPVKLDENGVWGCDVLITGYEDKTDMLTADLSAQYFHANTVKSQTINSNILFQGNVTQYDGIEYYEELQQLALHIYPLIVLNGSDLATTVTETIDENNKYVYTYNTGPLTLNLKSNYDLKYDPTTHILAENTTHPYYANYYNSQFVYNYTGYHDGEIYRFGVVFIRSDNSLTNVFDILGISKLGLPNEEFNDLASIYIKLAINGKNNSNYWGETDGGEKVTTINNRGVTRINNVIVSETDIIGIRMNFSEYVTIDTKKFTQKKDTFINIAKVLGVKGYFFVRQKRIPTMLALAYTTNICETAYVPSVNVRVFDYDKYSISGPLYNTYADSNQYWYIKAGSTSVNGIEDNEASIEYKQHYSPDNQKNPWYDLSEEQRKLYTKKYITANNPNYYLYESFCEPKFRLISSLEPYKWFYPKRSGSKTTTLKVRNNFYNHIFTLTDNSRCYFDKISGDVNPISCFRTIYLKDENYSYEFDFHLTSEEWDLTDDANNESGKMLGGQVIIYGPDSDPEQYMAWDTKGAKSDYNTTDADVKDKNKDKAGSYGAEITFFMKATDSEIDTLDLNSDKYIYLAGSLSLDEFYYTYATHNTSDFSDDDDLSNIHDIDCYKKITKLVCDAAYDDSVLYVDYTSGATNVKYYGYQYVLYNGIWYKFYNADEVHAWSHYRRLVQSRISNKLKDYIPSAAEILALGTIGITDSETNKGYDLTIPTFDGKYGYKSDTSKNNDYSSYAINPMEYNAFAGFCPEYELNSAYYNSLFTGQKLKAKFVTKPKAVIPNILRSFVYDAEEMDIDSNYKNGDTKEGTYYDTHALAIDEGVSLNAILHNLQIGKSKYVYRENEAFFSSRCGNSGQVDYEFAGPEFLCYVYPDRDHAKYPKDDSVPIEYKIRTNGDVDDDAADDRTVNMNGVVYIKSGGNLERLWNIRPFNLLRGIYERYVGLYPYTGEGVNAAGVDNFANRIVNIYIPGYDFDEKYQLYFELRFTDATAYYAICDRHSIDDAINTTTAENAENVCYRGDCFISYFTHRVNRNFNDSSAPYNDVILSSKSFYGGFDQCFDHEFRTLNTELVLSGVQFNLGDLNAVKMGMWVTFPCRASYNIALRADDESWTSEKMASGNYRSFHPLIGINPGGSYKMPSSVNYNQGFSKSGGEKLYVNTEEEVFTPYYYKNRITYSAKRTENAEGNGNRLFYASSYRDYTDLYGAIIKLVSLSTYLIVICEHGIFAVPVNELALAAQSSSGLIFINNYKVLPEDPYTILSEHYGTQWEESVVQTPYYVYGIDGTAKKIWRTNGNKIELISDFQILTFLNSSLSMFNKHKRIGVVNIKSHYNAVKDDVMFTAYDYEDHVLWNICWNEHFEKWLTFYSWIPSITANIGNNCISLDNKIDYATQYKLLHNDNSKLIALDDYNEEDLTKFTHKFWKHGLSDFIMSTSKILPTNWYGEQHPFEFEFVVNDNPLNHKIFTNLLILSNKAEPESFHYTVEGECYDFRNDKDNMFIRQELTKALYKYALKSAISFDKRCLDLDPHDVINQGSLGYRTISKSTLFPLYYSRVAEDNYIQEFYHMLFKEGYDYCNLSGAEILYDDIQDLFSVCNHVKGINQRYSSRLKGNMFYKEDKWDVLIPSINYCEKNEYLDKLFNGKLPLVLGNSPLPEDAIFKNSDYGTVFDDRDFCEAISGKYNPNNITTPYTVDDYDFSNWTSGRKEMRLKDKFAKIKIRYSGKDLAVISGILTLYNISYA